MHVTRPTTPYSSAETPPGAAVMPQSAITDVLRLTASDRNGRRHSKADRDMGSGAIYCRGAGRRHSKGGGGGGGHSVF